MSKDLFSDRTGEYSRYRPNYPESLFEYILGYVAHKEHAWDCATGNGQAALTLSRYFNNVSASDLSEAQVQKAVQAKNIEYIVCSAEETPYNDNSFDLVTVAQAYHWLDWEKFRHEATRVCKPGGVVAVWGYHLLRTGNEAIDKITDHFYYDITGPYWDAERKYIEDFYTTVAFDFEVLPSKDFRIDVQWPVKAFLGYLSTWSAVSHYNKATGNDPVLIIKDKVQAAWPNEIMNIHFPLFLRLGRVRK